MRDQFVELFCKNQNPDQSCRPIIGSRALLKRKLIKDFRKVGPIFGNPSYNSQCLLFWRYLTQKMPEIVPFDKKNSVKLTWKSSCNQTILQKAVCLCFHEISRLYSHSSLVDYLAQVINAKNCPTTFYCIFQLVWVPMTTTQNIRVCFLSSNNTLFS